MTKNLTTEELEAKKREFEYGADGGSPPEESCESDPNASPDFVSVRVGLNEYQWSAISKAANKRGLPKASFLRFAGLKLSEENI